MGGLGSQNPIQTRFPLQSQFTARGSLDISPILSSLNSSSNQSRSHSPSSAAPNTPQIPSRPLSPERQPLASTDSSTFLTAIAAQERRVLELKEELHKAEDELNCVKRQWAVHESTKKRLELRDVEPTHPPKRQQAGESISASDGSVQRTQPIERKRADTSAVRPAQRKVFSGSRHARTLSLLSGREPETRPVRIKTFQPAETTIEDSTRVPPNLVASPKSQSIRNISEDMCPPSDKDALLGTGKQLVDDFRSGLWTFFEDLRQVTVGEEVTKQSGRARSQGTTQRPLATEPVKTHSSNLREIPESKNNHRRVSGSLEQAEGLSPAPFASIPTAAAPTLHPKVGKGSHMANTSPGNEDSGSEDGWDSWAGPDARQETATYKDGPLTSPMTDRSTPRSSMGSVDTTPSPKRLSMSMLNKDQTGWPTLSQLTPGNLTRTASNLMTEWEKGLRVQETDSHTPEDPKTRKDGKAD